MRQYRELPESMWVGPLEFEIIQTSALDMRRHAEEGHDGEPWGCTNMGQLQIHILQTLHPAQQWATLWHEIVHCIDHILDGDMSENTINGVSMLILSVMMDNGIWHSSQPSSREALAKYAHEAWSDYMAYFFGKCDILGDGAVHVPAAYAEALRGLIAQSYEELDEGQKDNDRAQADKILEVLT